VHKFKHLQHEVKEVSNLRFHGKENQKKDILNHIDMLIDICNETKKIYR
jgi:hypothetical protein